MPPDAPRFSDYSLRITRLNGPGEPDSFYWHLYCKDVRVNGGMNDSETDARRYADAARASHMREHWNSKYFWDVESLQWLLKENLTQ